MERFDWKAETAILKAEWKSVSTMNGERCVMTCGMCLMLLWSADSWDMELMVWYSIVIRLKMNIPT